MAVDGSVGLYRVAEGLQKQAFKPFSELRRVVEKPSFAQAVMKAGAEGVSGQRRSPSPAQPKGDGFDAPKVDRLRAKTLVESTKAGLRQEGLVTREGDGFDAPKVRLPYKTLVESTKACLRQEGLVTSAPDVRMVVVGEPDSDHRRSVVASYNGKYGLGMAVNPHDGYVYIGTYLGTWKFPPPS